MPEFTFKSPDGKQYNITGPEGSTQEQAFQILQQQLSSGTAQPVEGQSQSAQSPQSQPQTPTVKERVAEALKTPDWVSSKKPPEMSPWLQKAAKEIGTSTVMGGALGAMSPEILTGAGIAVSAIPEVGPVLGRMLMTAGEAARGARLAAAATGAVSGATSETAGQVAEKVGAPPAVADAARFAAGFATPGAQLLASKMRGLYNAVGTLLGKDMQSAAVTKAATALRGMEEAGVPQHALHQALQSGADAEIKAAEQEGQKVLAEARQRAADVGTADARAAQRVLDDGQTRASQIVAEARQRAAQLNKISQGRMETAGKVLAQAEPALRVVGQPKELSDIGKELQQQVGAQHQAALQARNDAYAALKGQRDALVQQKEAAGQSIDQTPALQGLQKQIQSKLSPTRSGFVGVVDPGVRKAYESIQDAITRKSVDTGMLDAAGNPIRKQFKTSFEALDQVRRRLGDVVANRDVEGYSAIGKDLAAKLYAQISKAQQEFVGEVGGKNLQQEMQNIYKEGTAAAKGFQVGAAGKATALDRIDPERFAADPQGLPRQFFSSQQSVRDLAELTNPGLVDRTARSYVSQSLRGMSSKQVESWMQKNRDWMREVPGLQKDVQSYSQKLQRIEQTAGKVEKSAGQFAKQAEGIVPEAQKAASAERAETIRRAGQIGEGSVASQQRVLETGQKQAEAATKAAAQPAVDLQKMLQGGERPEAIRDLLLNGKPAQTRLAARIASQTPEGQRQLEQSVRQLTASMTEKTLQKTWTERLKPMLEDGKMLPPERMKQLEQDVQRLLRAQSGKPALTLAQKHILAALGTAAGFRAGINRE
jgi:hypothetical protein